MGDSFWAARRERRQIGRKRSNAARDFLFMILSVGLDWERKYNMQRERKEKDNAEAGRAQRFAEKRKI